MDDGLIETERLRLEPQVAEDADEMAVVLGDAALHRFIGGTPPTVDDLRERFARQGSGRSPDGDEEWWNWTVRRRSDAIAIGTVQATIVDGGRAADVAWVIGTPWQGRGHATEAARAMVTWLLDRGVRTVHANIHADHAASMWVARKSGLAPTGRTVGSERVWRRRAGGSAGSIRFPIVTERLLIRTTAEADARALHAAWGDPDVMRHLGPPLPTLDDTREVLAAKIAQQDRDGFSLWTVEERVTGDVVGTVGLQYEDGPEIGIGFLFAKASWGRGYGREAAAAALRSGFDELRLDRIMGITEPENLPARRLMEAIGMTGLGPAHYYGRTWTCFEALRAVVGEVPEE